MTKQWLNPYVDWLAVYQQADGSLNIVYRYEYEMNYGDDDGFRKCRIFTAADLQGSDLQKLVKSRFGKKAWDELLYTAKHIADEPTQFIDPQTNLSGLKDRHGAILLAAQFNYMWPFVDGLAMVSRVTDRDRRGMIDVQGNVIIQPVFETLGQLSGRRRLFRREFGGLYGYMNSKGRVVIQERFREATDFMSNARARVVNATGERGFIDIHGNFTPD
jgi:hypothetical protein